MWRHLCYATALAVLFGIGAQAGAQDKPQSPAKKVGPDVKLAQRASELIGMKVKNAAGKELGTVNDIVLDTAKGNVRYFAISYGGWLGLGDKLFAVPHQSFEWRNDAETNRTFVVLNLSESQLKNAPGFDENHWPDFANDAQWRQKIETYYKVEAKRETTAPR